MAVIRDEQMTGATVLYQIPGEMRGGPLGSAEIVRRRGVLQDWAAPGVTVDVADSPGGPLSIESQAEELMCVPPMISALSRRFPSAKAEAAFSREGGPDAVIIGCFGDPGLAALREILDCPVIGPFEASIHLAAQLGARVGVITILDSVVPMLDHLARGMGLSLRYAGAVAIDVPVLELKQDVALVAERLERAGQELIQRREADVIVLGCMSLAFLGLAERVAPAIGVPVVNPARCALKTAEALIAQKLLQSRRTYAKPRKGIVAVEETR
jgi:allantoin racemase